MATKTRKPSSGYTEDWLPLRGIQNNMIITRDNHKVAGVKISPKNIFILDSISQENTLIGLKNFYNMIDFEFWLVVADRPVDISVYMSQMQLLYNETQNPAIRKLIRQDIEKGQTFIHNNIVDTEYYFLFRAKDPELLQKRVRMMINGLATCGLNASQASNSDLRVILDNFLNGGDTTEFGMVMPVGLRSQIAPKGLQFSASEFFISDKYATILTVVSWPKYITPGYLSSLTNMPGIKIVVKHIPVPFQEMVKMLNKQVADFSYCKKSATYFYRNPKIIYY